MPSLPISIHVDSFFNAILFRPWIILLLKAVFFIMGKMYISAEDNQIHIRRPFHPL
jgi:hypothetical protein